MAHRNYLNIKDLQDWLESANMLYAAHKTYDGKQLRLIVTANGTFQILVNGEIKWQGIQPFSAIEKYNELL